MIDTEFFNPDADRWNLSSYTGREQTITNGKLLHFRAIDRRLDLPPGTARRLLNRVAERYELVPELKTHNIVRYAEKAEADDDADEAVASGERPE